MKQFLFCFCCTLIRFSLFGLPIFSQYFDGYTSYHFLFNLKYFKLRVPASDRVEIRKKKNVKDDESKIYDYECKKLMIKSDQHRFISLQNNFRLFQIRERIQWAQYRTEKAK